MDYFAFTRQTYMNVEIKDFAIGRVAFDNWLVYHAAANNATVVSATDMVSACAGWLVGEWGSGVQFITHPGTSQRRLGHQVYHPQPMTA